MQFEVFVVALPSPTTRIDSHLSPERVSDTSVRDRIFAIAATIRERDVLTSEHSRRVAIYAQRLARALGYARSEARQYALLGLIHDVGKVWITDTILNKKGPLAPDEIKTIRLHALNGASIVAGYDLPLFYIAGVYHHHEAYNGSGYPDHLCAEEIPEPARVIAIADAYDVITSSRPYKEAESSDHALQMLHQGAGTCFDIEMVRVFIDIAQQHPHFLVLPRLCVLPQNAAWHQIATGF